MNNKIILGGLWMVWMMLFPVLLCSQTDAHFQAGMDEKNSLKKVRFFTQSIEVKPTNDAYFERGLAFTDLRRYHSAIKDFKSAFDVQGNKMQADLNNAIAYCYLLNRQYEKAVDYATRTLNDVDHYYFAYRTRFFAYYYLGAYDKAELDINKYINFIPEYADGYNLRQMLYFSQKKYAKALNDIDSALKRDITNRNFKLRKIFTLNRLGRNAEAEKLIRESIDIKDDDPYSLQAVGSIFAEMGDYERAVVFHLQALNLHDERIKKNPRYRTENIQTLFDLYLLLANNYRSANEPAKALRYCTQAVNLMPTNFEGYKLLGDIHCIDLKNYDLAVGAYSRCFEINPKHPEGWVNFGYSLSQVGKEASAINIYERALKLDSVYGKATIFNNLGYGYLKVKKYPQALINIQKAINEEPDEPMFHISLGEYYLELKKYQDAILKFDFALEMETVSDHEKAVAYLNRGLAYFRQKELSKAIMDLQNSVDLEPENIEAVEACAIAYFESGELCKAQKLFRKAVQADIGQKTSKAPLSKNYLLRIASKLKEPCH